METIDDIVREMREGMGWPNPDGRPLTARVQDHLFKIYADRIEEAAKQMEIQRIADIARECAKVKAECDAENTRLRAALRPVVNCELNPIVSCALGIPNCELWLAIQECKRIFNESEAK